MLAEKKVSSEHNGLTWFSHKREDGMFSTDLLLHPRNNSDASLIAKHYYNQGWQDGYEEGSSSETGSYICLTNEVSGYKSNETSLMVERMEAELIMYILKEKYELKNVLEIEEYIIKHPSLARFVFQAAKKFEEYFGDEVTLELVKESDPEYDEEGLFAYIYTELSVEEALHKLDLLDEQWFIPNTHKINGRFGFNVAWR